MHCTTLLDLFRQQGIAISIVTTPELGTSASDGLLLNLFSVFAEFERDLIRERLSETRTALKNRGRRVAGAIPFGYTTDPVSKQLLPDRREARRVKAMFERAAKGETPRQIAAHANRARVANEVHSIPSDRKDKSRSTLDRTPNSLDTVEPCLSGIDLPRQQDSGWSPSTACHSRIISAGRPTDIRSPNAGETTSA